MRPANSELTDERAFKPFADGKGFSDVGGAAISVYYDTVSELIFGGAHPKPDPGAGATDSGRRESVNLGPKF